METGCSAKEDSFNGMVPTDDYLFWLEELALNQLKSDDATPKLAALENQLIGIKDMAQDLDAKLEEMDLDDNELNGCINNLNEAIYRY